MDGDLRAQHFPWWFDFSRPSAQPYRDADGDIVEAGPDEPRFDHDDAGRPRGLLVTFGATLGAGDRVRLQEDILTEAIGAECTVFHAVTLDDGSLDRRAWYSRNPRATINGLMATVAAHASIGVLPGFRPNRGGHVRYRGERWSLANAIAVDSDPIGRGIALADDAGRALIEQ